MTRCLLKTSGVRGHRIRASPSSRGPSSACSFQTSNTRPIGPSIALRGALSLVGEAGGSGGVVRLAANRLVQEHSRSETLKLGLSASWPRPVSLALLPVSRNKVDFRASIGPRLHVPGPSRPSHVCLWTSVSRRNRSAFWSSQPMNAWYGQ